MQEIGDKLIVALDVGTLKEAGHFLDILYPAVKMFKVGSQLFTAYGPEFIKIARCKGAKVFLDLKFYDIPNTVSAAVASATNLENVFMITVHAQGGSEMMKAAVRGAQEEAKKLNIKKPHIVGVTVLTSASVEQNTGNIVLERALLAQDAGLDGVVCSVKEAADVRAKLGKDFIIVTPGIRSALEPKDDQKRTATAKEAIEAGADFIVVGRPILKAADPLKAVKEIFL
jgi:orotidine-5'-phosphate decarboxylase